MSVIGGLESWTGVLEHWSTGVLECQTKRLKIVLTGGASTDKHIVNLLGQLTAIKSVYFTSLKEIKIRKLDVNSICFHA